jgi:leucyl aminopeptidase
MRTPYELPRVAVRPARPDAANANLLIIPVAQDHTAAAAARFDAAVGGELASALQRGEFQAKPNQTFVCRVMAGGWSSARVVFVGGGPRGELSAERFRRMAATAGRLAREQRQPRVAWLDAEAGALGDRARIETIVEGLTRANFDGGFHKSRDEGKGFLTEAAVLSDVAGASEASQIGQTVGESINGARALVDEPGNHLTPTRLAERAVALASVPGITAEVLDRDRIEALKMGLLLAVARGSAEPPRVVVLRYEPEDAPAGRTLGLIGKGITFDSGGLSLKPADSMERMKDDMAGAATVVAAIRAIALERLPIRVTAIVASTENMPGGRALKPGDVITGASGLTIEVNNTDAEGRLILGDALWYARQLGATHLIDVATLTGSVVVALGKITTGLYGTPQSWISHIRDAAERAGEKIWQLPLFDEYREQLDSDIADMLNSPGRPAGSITAALFLKEFAGGGAWAHLDIAGTAWAEENKPWQPKGATGVMIRTLVEVARGGSLKDS